MKKYLTKAGEDALRAFQYSGKSIAYSYVYLWAPLAEFCLRFIPTNWAPNTLTLIGTVINIIGNLALIVQGIGNQLQPWTLFFFGCCVFVYQTLDNMDGKQARKTNSSSPLGMCMDHGCDVLGVSFLTLGVAQIAHFDDTDSIMITAQVAVLGAFWMSTWAQYHSKGVLILGKFNAVDDGIPTVAFLGIITYFLGQSIWTAELLSDWKGYDFLHLLIWAGGIGQTLNFMFNSGENFTKDFKHATSHFLHFIPLVTANVMVVYMTDWHHTDRYFIPLYFSMVLPIARDTSYMHVCVVAKEKYEQYQLATLLPGFGFMIYIVLRQCLGVTLIPQGVFIYAMFAMTVWLYGEYVIRVSLEMADALSIRIFHIKPVAKSQ